MELWFNLRQKNESYVCSKSPRPALGLAHSPVSCLMGIGFSFPEGKSYIYTKLSSNGGFNQTNTRIYT